MARNASNPADHWSLNEFMIQMKPFSPRDTAMADQAFGIRQAVFVQEQGMKDYLSSRTTADRAVLRTPWIW
jgi:hypothetical protein